MTKSLICMLSVAFLAIAGENVCADVANGTFDSDLTNWIADGTTQVISAGSNKMIKLHEPGTGSRSRIYQDGLDAPTSATWLSFRYQLFSGNGTRPLSLPPDSFSAYLIDVDGDRVILGPTEEPTFSKAFFYIDSDGQTRFDASLVNVTEFDDAEGLRTVMLNVPIGVDDDLRVEFGLDGAGNNVTSFALVDDVTFGCGTAFCCQTDGTVTEIDDGLACTTNGCDPVLGVTHPPLVDTECCGECPDPSSATDIMVMIDASSSTEDGDFRKSLNAVNELVNFFEGSPIRPRIGVGTFVDGRDFDAQGNRIESDGIGARVDIGLTSNYDELRADLYDDTKVYNGEHRTPVSVGIAVARDHLLASQPNRNKYLILITDGWTNKPDQGACEGGSNCNGSPCANGASSASCICCCGPARTEAEAEALVAKENSVRILVAHYIGQNENTCSTSSESDDVTNAKQWLENNIAHTPGDFFENPGEVGNLGLECPFIQIAELINCDDGVPCTTDLCVAGVCTHDQTDCETGGP